MNDITVSLDVNTHKADTAAPDSLLELPPEIRASRPKSQRAA